jgi:hypothetical protein
VRSYTVVTAGQAVGRDGPAGGDLVAAQDLTVLGWPGLTYQITVTLDPTASATRGATIGTVRLDGEQTHEKTPIVYR